MRDEMSNGSSTGEIFVQEFVIGFGFLSGLFVNIGVDPEGLIYETLFNALAKKPPACEATPNDWEPTPSVLELAPDAVVSVPCCQAPLFSRVTKTLPLVLNVTVLFCVTHT